jgi:uncharacterized protein
MEAAVRIINIAAASLVALSPAFAQNSTPQSQSRPSDASVHELLQIMDAKKLVEAIPEQVDKMMTATLQQRLQGQSLSAEQQQAIDAMRAKVAALMKDELDWSVMEPIYVKIYEDTFSQSEIDGMVAFYRSPTGHAIIQKLPLVMQSAMTLVQQRMASLMPRIQEMARETAAQIKTQSAADAKGKTG